jgi:hypothetical protein
VTERPLGGRLASDSRSCSPIAAERGRSAVEAVDHVVGGDVVPGPMQRETLACLLDVNTPVEFIQGNCEVAVLARIAGTDAGTLPEQAREAVRWSARQLHPDHERLLARWPKTLRVGIPGLGEA